MDEPTTEPRVSRLDLLFYTRAHNRHEITLEEWIRLTREWAEAMERQYGTCYTERDEQVFASAQGQEILGVSGQVEDFLLS